MEKALFTLVESGSKSGNTGLITAIVVAIIFIAGYLLLRKKKE